MKNLLFLLLLTMSVFSCRKSAIVDGTPWEGCLTNYYSYDESKYDQIYLDEDLPWVQAQDAVMDISYALEGQANPRATFKYHDVYKRVTLPSGREQFIVTVAGLKKSFCKIYNQRLYSLDSDYTLNYYGDNSSVDSIVMTRIDGQTTTYTNIQFNLYTHAEDPERNRIKFECFRTTRMPNNPDYIVQYAQNFQYGESTCFLAASIERELYAFFFLEGVESINFN